MASSKAITRKLVLNRETLRSLDHAIALDWGILSKWGPKCDSEACKFSATCSAKPPCPSPPKPESEYICIDLPWS